MKKYIILFGAILALLISMWVQHARLVKCRNERDTYASNTHSLLKDVERYKTNDSLNVAEIGVLSLKISEYKNYREEDAKLINSLRVKNRTLTRVTKSQIETIRELNGRFRDSIVYIDKWHVDTLRCIDIVDKWFELHGCANKNGDFTGRFESRDSLVFAETVKYKRFLGFLWKTNKVKSRKVDVVSKNPHTKINDVEVIVIDN